MAAPDFGIRELSRMTLKLREDLRFTFQESEERPCYLIEDRAQSQFFRIGVPEYVFISLLDGATTVQTALGLTADLMGPDAFTESDAATICRWLVESHLAYTEESSRAGRLFAAARERSKRKLISRLNPLFIKIPLVNPDRFFHTIQPWLNWLLGWQAAVVWFVLLLCGGFQIASQPERFARAATSIFAPGNWLALGLVWILLKIIHETFHGLVCKKYGGSVLESGVLLILFAPVAYVDVTSAWRVMSKWHRIYISAAGMYVEIFCAAVAALVWSATGPGVLNHLAYNTVIMAGVSTLIVNGNPLLRFDGYYILADLLDVTNLYSRGQEFVRYLGRKYLLGLDVKLPRGPARRSLIIKTYGLLATCWRLLVVATMLIAAQALFHGVGVLLAILGVILWFGVPTAKFLKFLWYGSALEKPKVARFLLTTGSGLAGIGLLLGTVPWPGVARAPGVVEYASSEIVRPEVDGFVAQVLVSANDLVVAGQPLLKLKNDELEIELAELRVAVDESAFREHRYRQQGLLAASQMENRRGAALREQQAEAQDLVDQLLIRAPVAGRVMGRQLDGLLGRFVRRGSDLLTVANDSDKRISISIRQDDSELFASRLGSPVTIQTYVGGFPGRLVQVSPKAGRQISHAALAATMGGPLAVRPVLDTPSPDGESPEPQNTAEYAVPRVEGRVEFQGEVPAGVMAGQRVVASFRTCHETIGQHVYLQLAAWFRAASRYAQQQQPLD